MTGPDPAGGFARATTAVAPGAPDAPGVGPLPVRVADALLAHPAVAGLSGGSFGTIASYLPGRRQPGVALGGDGEPTRIAVVLHFGAPVAATAAELRGIVAGLTGADRVDVVVADLAMPGEDAVGTSAP